MTVFPSFEQIVPRVEAQMKEAQVLRATHKKKMLRNALIMIAMWIGLLVCLLANLPGGLVGLLFVVVLIVSCVLIGLSLGGIRNFHHTYKVNVINATLQQLFRMIEPPEDEEDYRYRVRYRPNKYIHNNQMRKSKLLSSFNRSSGEDYTSGQIGLTTFEFSEVHLKHEEEYRDKDGRKKTRVKTVFSGVAFIADFHKDFVGQTYLIRKKWLNQRKWSLQFSGAHAIELEDMAFNKMFETMTTDDIEARYILSSNLMQRIMEYAERAHGPVQISFVDSKMYILTETNKDLFEGRFWRSNDREALRIIYEEFMTYFNIVEAFTLNRRIWSKR
ncbi:MAG TPA: DUF3137 domain-containing protein [Sporosarcina sp.]|nr:DUF3137 domain-containing protein [Sporosarcina sp.]